MSETYVIKTPIAWMTTPRVEFEEIEVIAPDYGRHKVAGQHKWLPIKLTPVDDEQLRKELDELAATDTGMCNIVFDATREVFGEKRKVRWELYGCIFENVSLVRKAEYTVTYNHAQQQLLD
jgi:hypothetical protein